MKIAYADCFSGISGDMFLGALLDAGLPAEKFKGAIVGLGLKDYDISIKPGKQSGLACTKVNIVAGDSVQPHRKYPEILKIIQNGGLETRVRDKACEVFTVLAEAEARVHRCHVGEVHFHEVGAVDSIIDIVGSVFGLEYFGISKLICSPLPMPRGWVDCAHGKLPVPAPAVCEILRGVPVYGEDFNQELVTPTGAAIVKALAVHFGIMPSLTINSLGYGAGSRINPEGRPNLFRLVIGDSYEVSESQRVEVIETHLDDWMPEGYPFLCERLFNAGALDVALMPIQMKKGRPGFLLRVIVDMAHGFELKNIILSETTAIGLRYRVENRMTLPRESGIVETAVGSIKVKKVETPTGPVLSPEYEDCKRVAIEKNIPLRSVYDAVGKCPPDVFRRK